MLNIGVTECFGTVTRYIVVIKRFSKLALGKVAPALIDYVVEMPDVTIPCFTDTTSEQIICDKACYIAVTSGRVFSSPK